MDSLNVSYSLNKLGPWADSLLSGVYGSAATVNLTDPLSSALPVITQQPGAFLADHLLPNDPGEGKGTTAATTSGGISGAAGPGGPIMIPPEWLAWLVEKAGEAPKQALGLKDDYIKTFAKNSLVVIVGLMLLAFGLWILLYPTAKPYLIEGAKAGAKAAAA